MNSRERKEPFSASDKNKVQNKLDGASNSGGCLFPLAFFLILCPFFCLLLPNGEEGLPFYLVAICTGIILIPIGVWMIYSQVKGEGLLKKDEGEGMKIVVVKKLSDKRESHSEYSASYYLKFDDVEFETDLSNYVKAEVGNEFELHHTPNAKFLLEMKFL